MIKILAGLGAMVLVLASGSAFAAQPTPWQIGFQPPATEMMAWIAWFEDYTLWFIVPITFLVLGLLAGCIIRFRASVNPVPSRTRHNTLIEVIWTVAPVIILLFIAVPSYHLLSEKYNPT